MPIYFLKSISSILEIISSHGRRLNINKNQLSHIPINNFWNKNFINNKNRLLSISKKNKEKHTIFKSIKLPQVIYDIAGVKIIHTSKFSNFITRKKLKEKIF